MCLATGARIFRYGKAQSKRRSASAAILRFDRTAMVFDDRLHHGEPEAAPGNGAGTRAAEALLEEMRRVARIDTGAAVVHANTKRTAVLATIDFDASSRARVVDCVREDVRDDLADS